MAESVTFVTSLLERVPRQRVMRVTKIRAVIADSVTNPGVNETEGNRMTASQLQSELEATGIALALHQGGLRATGETRLLTSVMRAGLGRHKLELMVRLGKRQAPPVQLVDLLLEKVSLALLGGDLDEVIEEVQQAHQQRHLTADEAEQVTVAAGERSAEIPYRVEDMLLS